MSRETIEWLENNTLVGFTEKRGKAWHYRQGADNHYTGGIPVDDVRKRLFDWTAEERNVWVEAVDEGRADRVVPGRKAIVRSDTGAVLGIFTDSYQPHDYDEWLLGNVMQLLDGDLAIGSAGLLRGGGQAWVQVEMPETIETPEGVKFRPFLLATTSLDGTLATSYSRAVTNVVCDNTMAIALGEEHDQKVRVRHSSKSLGKLQDARDALGIVYTAADDFARQVATLTSQRVTETDFLQLAAQQFPFPEDPRKARAAYNQASANREYVFDLYRFDERVAPWTGTAFGAWQAFNTFQQHENRLRKGTIRAERNMGQVVTGKRDKADHELLADILELAS